MQHIRSPVSLRRARRLGLSAVVLAALAGTALAFQGAASSAVSTASRVEQLHGSLPARPGNRFQKLDTRLVPSAASARGLSAVHGLKVISPAVVGGKVLVDVTTDRPAAVRGS